MAPLRGGGVPVGAGGSSFCHCVNNVWHCELYGQFGVDPVRVNATSKVLILKICDCDPVERVFSVLIEMLMLVPCIPFAVLFCLSGFLMT